MRTTLLAWMAVAALMAAACTQSGNAERSTSGGLVMGAAVGALAPTGR